MPSKNINDFEKETSKENQSKRWKGLKQDSTGKFLVYVTDTTEKLFDDLDSAVNYLKQAAKKEDLKKEASTENAVEQRGQENLEGLKEVITRKKLVQTADGKYKVMESKRYNMKSEDSEDAKDKLNNIDFAREQVKVNPKEEEDDALEEITENPLEDKTSSLQYGPIGTCLHCHASIYPPNSDMDYWFNRQLPADLYCPACGYGIGTPGNFNYENAKMNEQSVENMIHGYKSASIKVSSLIGKKAGEVFTTKLSIYNTELSESDLITILKNEGIAWGEPDLDNRKNIIRLESIEGEIEWEAYFNPGWNTVGVLAKAIKANVVVEYRDEFDDTTTGSVSFEITDFENVVNITGNNLELITLNIYEDKTATANFGSKQ